MFSQELTDRASALLDIYKARGWHLATAESCTGGALCGLLTDISGSSAVVERGFVTYTNQSKAEMLGVPEWLLASYGAVSAPVAMAMARGALAHAPVEAALSITGIAGPGGGSTIKPVGTVHLCAATTSGLLFSKRICNTNLDRNGVREAAIFTALEMLRTIGHT
ncbi:CinA family protein [Polycladidibacter hongkongensis]|uniref:CinA family protein n=1 Tax=Polycladidibacter hongkongensis TaxID=1647556 RepID=UPI00082C58B3|nr:CinA family protein [Pseudovibrio hongkongensis]